MFFKYFIKFKYNNQYVTRYIRAKSNKDAILRLMKDHKDNTITSIELLGEPLPSRQDNATHLIKKKNEAKEKKRKGAIKYYQLAGKTVFDK